MDFFYDVEEGKNDSNKNEDLDDDYIGSNIFDLELNGDLDNDGDNIYDKNILDDNIVEEGNLIIEDFNKVEIKGFSKKEKKDNILN